LTQAIGEAATPDPDRRYRRRRGQRPTLHGRYGQQASSPLDPPEAEPNNSPGTATALPLTETPAGSGFFMAVGVRAPGPGHKQYPLVRPGLLALRGLGWGRGQPERGQHDGAINPCVELRSAANSTLTSDDNYGLRSG